MWTRIIINYKRIEDVASQLGRIASNSEKLPPERIVVVDNSPTETKRHPEAYEAIKKYTTYIASDDNLGYGYGANRGAKETFTEWLVFLNTDVDVTTEALKNFVKRAEERGLDASCPTTEDPRYGMPLPSSSWFLGTFTPLKRFSYFLTRARKQPLTLWGGCLLIRRSVFEDVGGFDERFFLWFEDSDLTKRLIETGYKVGRVDVPGLSHIGGVSFEKMSEKEKRKIFFTSASIYVNIHGKWYDRLLVQILRLRYGVLFQVKKCV